MEEFYELLAEFLYAIDETQASGEEIPDEVLGQVAETLNALNTRIEQIEQAQNPPPPPEPNEPPPSPDAQLLWILAGQQPQAFISYLRSYPTQATQALLSNPGQLNATIQRLSQMMPQGEQPVQDGIQHADLNSSNVWGARYDPRSGKMRVRFQGGSIYEYDGIPRPIFDAFIHGNAEARTSGQNQYGRWWKNKNPTLGGAFHKYIKAGNFPYRRIR